MSGQTGRASRGGVQALWPSLGDWVQQSTLVPARPTIGAIVSVLLCTSYQTLLIARLLFAGTTLDGNAYAYTRDWYGALVVAFIAIGAAVLLIWRSRQPLAVLLIECVLYATASAVGMSNYLLFPLLFALFSCVTRPPAWQVAAGLGSVWAVMTFSAFTSRTSTGFALEYMGQLLTAFATIAVAVATRSVHSWQRTRKHALEEERRSQALARQRDRAVSRTRIAAELHDSVGHGLTTIIALAEGLAGTTGDPHVDEALAGINTVARESLEDTRHAVRALADTADEAEEDTGGKVETDRAPSDDAPHGPVPSLHEWAEILPVLGRVRALGVTVVFTETGRRSPNAHLADLCFAITREAVTNAMRHGDGLRQLTVSWDHGDDRATTVTVRSIGAPQATKRTPDYSAPSPPGTGLRRLQRAVEDTGGTMSSGWATEDEWVVRAVVRAAAHPTPESPPNRSAPREGNP
ncbi:Signal transduction histidine kinase [Sinosporangium album]|uniref:histidine kinase n=1 Tax=Sinosporangium album TaxID=504805 RepID=A0A1G8HP01_9ACTN|nr:histidine kinase [Sinosporangium album]SDI08354.1 Signal transduction histidine kinase [Sinosporangium album]